MEIKKNDLHLVILSGQSNMSRMPIKFFKDAIHKRLGTDNVLIVKHALGGQPISIWDQQISGWFYDRMLAKIRAELAKRKGMDLKSITFIWAQGATDVWLGRLEQYDQSFDNVMSQLRRDLGRDDINLIIARMNDWSHTDDWMTMRNMQMNLAYRYGGTWVNTDGFNGPNDSLHDILAGYKARAEAYADVFLGYECFRD